MGRFAKNGENAEIYDHMQTTEYAIICGPQIPPLHSLGHCVGWTMLNKKGSLWPGERRRGPTGRGGGGGHGI